MHAYHFLYYFDTNGIRYMCYKLIEEEVYFIREVVPNRDNHPETYMTRENFNSFLNNMGII